jgi:hypothetical protein
MIEGTLPNGDKVTAVRTTAAATAGTLNRVSVNSAGSWVLTAISTLTNTGASAAELAQANGTAFALVATSAIATGAIRMLNANNTSIPATGPLFASNVNFFYFSGGSISHTATGVQNVPSINAGSYAVVEGGPNAPRVVAVFINGSPVITDPSAIAYIASGTSLGANTTVTGESGARRTLNVYLNGVRTEVPVSHTAIGTGSGELNLSGGANTFFTFTQNQNGVYTFTPTNQTGTVGNMTNRKSITITSAANTVEANRWASFDGSTDLDISNAVFVNLRSNNNPSTSDAAAFSSVANRATGDFTISYIFNTNTKVVSVIFVEAVT